MNGHALRELAQAWATVAHDGVSRKGAGEPYINHCARVAESVWGWRAKTLAWLHDTIEDASDPKEMEAALRTVFPKDIVDDVLRLSRLPLQLGENVSPEEQKRKQPYQEWVEDIANSGREDAIRVKLADVQDNLKDISDIPGAKSLQMRYLRAQATLLDALPEE